MDRPEEFAFDCFYLECFNDLCTERRFELAPIPVTAIRHYAHLQGLSPNMHHGLVRIIRMLDEVYLQWWHSDAEIKARGNARKSGKSLKKPRHG